MAGFREALQQGGLKAGVRYLRGALGEHTPQVIRHLYEQGAFREIRSAGEWAEILKGVRKEAGLEVHPPDREAVRRAVRAESRGNSQCCSDA